MAISLNIFLDRMALGAMFGEHAPLYVISQISPSIHTSLLWMSCSSQKRKSLLNSSISLQI